MTQNLKKNLLQRLRTLNETSDVGLAGVLLLLGLTTRLLAIPASLWEWDDFLFANAIHRFDLAEHSPHPPGFPVFVVMTRLAFAVLEDEHRALVAVSFVFASLFGPALFYFYRAVFEDRVIALAGALIGSVAPNIWVHGGAGRSDGVALTLGVVALTLAIQGLRSQRALLLASALFGVSIGVRVTILPVVAPTLTFVCLVRLRYRAWKLVALAVAVALIGMLSWYVPLIIHTTWRLYSFVMGKHSEFTVATDTILSATENSVLSYRLHRFFLDVWGAPWIVIVMYACSAIGLVMLAARRQWRTIGLMTLAFAPFLVFVFILNTPLSAPLYSFPYIPLFTGLAAAGIVMLPRALVSLRTNGWRRIDDLGLAFSIAFMVGLASWAHPMVKLLHREKSPPVRAIEHLRRVIDPPRDLIWFDGLFWPHLRFSLPDVTRVLREEGVNLATNLIGPPMTQTRVFGLTLQPTMSPSEAEFHWSDGKGSKRLRRLSLGRYFDAYVSDLTNLRRVVPLSGFFEEEHDAAKSWRWMGRQGKLALLNEADAMKLRVVGATASTVSSEDSPTIVLRLDGKELDRIHPKGGQFERDIVIKPGLLRLWSTLVLETDRVFIPSASGASNDSRELGVQWFALDFSPVPGAKPRVLNPAQYLQSGWYPLEGQKGYYWRWTSGDATVLLPPIEGAARLHLKMLMPSTPDGISSKLRIEMAGHLLEAIEPPVGFFERTYVVPASSAQKGMAELKFLVGTQRLQPDQRPLGVAVYSLVWSPADSNK